jgi:hypothetical protein
MKHLSSGEIDNAHGVGIKQVSDFLDITFFFVTSLK